MPRLREAARAILAREESGFAKDAELSLPRWKPAYAETQRLSKAQKLEKMFDELEAGTLTAACKISALNEVDPAYDAVLRSAVRQFAGDAGIRLEDVTWSILTVFITAPRLPTPFHGDFEQNFLLQIQGEKEVRLYDRENRRFFPQDAIEGLCKGDPLAAPFDEAFSDMGTLFHIKPGVGVHHPLAAPHSVTNGDSVSISVAIAFCTKEIDDLSRVHQANLFLRSVGLRPPFPDLSTRRDRMKAAFFRVISGPRDSCSALSRGYARLTWPARFVRDEIRKLRAARPGGQNPSPI
ncbi:hypothetical protein [Methylocapsa palsarum]|uniref:hypothetical protein n=1 Tax=Methylocapsa palsarum TaxID=1612308 RepID=UPI001113DA8B|nr:hypothetical protein [Methylocapsa palsarum]